MFELRMTSLAWSQIETAQFHPKGRTSCTLTAAGDDKLVLHGGNTNSEDQTIIPITLSGTWIMDLKSHSWKPFTSRKDHARSFHTGSTELNNTVIIIGGSMSCQRDQASYGLYNTIFNVILGPKSLQQVAMHIILKYQKELPLNSLPRKLLSLLNISVKDQDILSESEHSET